MRARNIRKSNGKEHPHLVNDHDTLYRMKISGDPSTHQTTKKDSVKSSSSVTMLNGENQQQ